MPTARPCRFAVGDTTCSLFYWTPIIWQELGPPPPYFFPHYLVIFRCLLWAPEHLIHLLKGVISFLLVIIAWNGNRDAWNEVFLKVVVYSEPPTECFKVAI